MAASAPLQTLFLPLESGLCALPGPEVLFINGQVCEGLESLRGGSLLVQQYFRAHQRNLDRAGFETAPEIPGDRQFDAVLLHNPRQREENLYAMAAGLKALRPGGLFLCAASNDAGGRRLEGDAAAFGIDCQSLSKHKARAVWTTQPQKADREAIGRAIFAGGYQSVGAGAYISRPGVFSWNHIDAGSSLLMTHLPEGLAGEGADFGCGFGCLAKALLEKNPDIRSIHCADTDARAVESCRRTLEKAGFSARIRHSWADIVDPSESLPRNLDWIVMNPPFHEGKAALPQVGQGFIRRAAECLKLGGRLWMVANATLPYEEALAASFSSSRRICRENGYKIFEAQK